MLGYHVHTPDGYLTREALFAAWSYTPDPLRAFQFQTADEAHEIGARTVNDHFTIVRNLDGPLERPTLTRVPPITGDAVASLGRIEFDRLASAALLEGLRVTPEPADVPPLRDMITRPEWSPFLTGQLARFRVEVR